MTDEPQDPAFEHLLQYLLENRGFDFSGYKRTTLHRRLARRMSQVGVADYTAYLDYLRAHQEEFAALFNTILINVTGYFRDAPAWEYLQREILPRLIAAKERYEPIRVWSAGVASGEEAYSVAMLLSEALGASEYRDRTKIYATDVDEDALTQARQGRAEDKDLEEVPAELREKYFEREGDRYLLRSDLRRSIIFGRHDLVQDAPISRIDLLICRNTLMYFESEAQAKILARLHYALNENGYLFLGKAEMLLSRDALFTPVELKHRIFTKVPKVSLRERLLVLAQAGNVDMGNQVTRQTRLRDVVADTLPLAHLVVDAGGYLMSINQRARSLFGLVTADIGRPLQDLEVSYRPAELRSMIDQAYKDRRPLEARDVERRSGNGDAQYFDVEVVPLLDNDATLLGASVTFIDVTGAHRLYRELERSKQELETASEELQSTNEELETTNEELQSTIEELETTNEELQSTNEELETAKEELQSTNEELTTVNEELQNRNDELSKVNSDLSNLLSSVNIPIIMLGNDLRIRRFTPMAEKVMNLIPGDIGRPITDIKANVKTPDLKQAIQRVIDSLEIQEFRVEDNDGRWYSMRIRPYRTIDNKIDGVVMIFLDIDSRRAKHP